MNRQTNEKISGYNKELENVKSQIKTGLIEGQNVSKQQAAAAVGAVSKIYPH